MVEAGCTDCSYTLWLEFLDQDSAGGAERFAFT
jgi:hypothetical protein